MTNTEIISKCPICNELTLATIEKLNDEESGDSYHVQCQNPKCEWDEWVEPFFPSELLGISLGDSALRIIRARHIDLTEEQWKSLHEDMWYALTQKLIKEGITEAALYNLGIGIKKGNKK